VIDVEKHVTYWQKGAVEDWDVAIQLIAINKIRHGLFFLHLARTYAKRQNPPLSPPQREGSITPSPCGRGSG